MERIDVNPFDFLDLAFSSVRFNHHALHKQQAHIFFLFFVFCPPSPVPRPPLNRYIRYKRYQGAHIPRRHFCLRSFIFFYLYEVTYFSLNILQGNYVSF